MSQPSTLGEVATLIGGALEGDPAIPIRGLQSLERAQPGELSFVVAARHATAALLSGASGFVVGLDVTLAGRPVIRVERPHAAVATLLGVFFPEPAIPPGVHPTAVVAQSARVAPDASVLAFCVVGEESVIESGARLHPHVVVGRRCRIGEGSVLHPQVVLREDVTLGRRVVIHSGAVLGADGFGYAFDGTSHRKIPQVGRVVIADDVEIGANTAIDRATLGETVVGRGTKIDNLVQIGHNTMVGEQVILVAQVGIAGSCRIGNGVVMGGQAGVTDHATIGDGARIGSQAGVRGEVAAGASVFGSPAFDASEARRALVALPRLPELLRTVRRLEKRVAQLEEKLRIEGGHG